MRILIACELYPPSVGGVQEVMRQVAERLVERGHRVTVATTHLPHRRDRTVNGVQITEFRVSGNLSSGLTGEVEEYRRYIANADYDIFIVKAAQQWTLDALWPVLGRLRRPKVFIPCGFAALYEPAFAEYYRQMPGILRDFDHLLFYASDYRDVRFARQHGIEAYTLIPNGASEREFGVARDAGFRARHDIPEDAFVVLTVGTLSTRKGHREVAKAFSLARFPSRAVLLLNGNVPADAPTELSASTRARALYERGGILEVFRAVGRKLSHLAVGRSDGKDDVRAELERLVAGINRGDPAKRAVVMDLARDDLIQAYLHADLFVFASAIEYSPLVLYEAAAAGLPFLSVPVGNAAEIASWTGAGIICPAMQDERGYTVVDPTILAEQISLLAADRERLRELGRTGRRNWLERFTWASIVESYEALFTRLVAARARQGAAKPR